MAKQEEDKKPRVCGVCKKAGTGHNARTCPMNPKNQGKAEAAPEEVEEAVEDEGEAVEEAKAPVEAAPPPRATKPATVDLAPAAAPISSDQAPVEFEEFSKQVDAKGTVIKVSTREYPAGPPSITLRLQDEKGVKEVQMGLEVLAKTWELFGVVLQRQAVRKSDAPQARHNGKAQSVET